MTNEQLVERARRAKSMLDSDLWEESWGAYRARLIEIIETAHDDAAALEARRMLRAAGEARAHLARIISDGAVAAADIKLDGERKRASRWNVLGV